MADDQHRSSAPMLLPEKKSTMDALSTKYAIDNTAYANYLSDRRRSFRFRGSQGTTVASAPSCDNEDYRSPRPLIPTIKPGKSFDAAAGERDRLCNGIRSNGSTNGLLQVGADFLRVSGSRQQFKNLLSARKKLGSLPPAYTRVDDSRDSIDSHAVARLFDVRLQGPVITVEDTGTELRYSYSAASSICNSQKSSLDKSGGSLATSDRAPLARRESRYGVKFDGKAAKLVYRTRCHLLDARVKIMDRALALAVFGILLMMIDCELTGQKALLIDKDHAVSLVLRTGVASSTIALLVQIILYHANEVKLDLIDCGADDWRVVVTHQRVAQFLLEFLICSICPIPGTGYIDWTFIQTDRTKDTSWSMPVPLDLPLSLMMFLRVYLLARFMVLHSKLFQDASTRTLAALNRIQMNFSFVLKTMLGREPIILLSIFTLAFWIVTTWVFTQCERFGLEQSASTMYSNSIWFIAITFMLNGYGDIVPKTHCGRSVAILVGVVGAVVSSTLIAVISRKMLLTRGERNVNDFMYDSRLSRAHKEAAATVLQQTWRIHKCLSSQTTSDRMLRRHQRRFLAAIHRFRTLKNEIRRFTEATETSQQLNRLANEVNCAVSRMNSAHEEMRAQMEVFNRMIRNFTSNNRSVSPARVAFDVETNERMPDAKNIS